MKFAQLSAVKIAKQSWKYFIAGFIAASVILAGIAIAYASGNMTAVTAYISDKLHISYNGGLYLMREADGSEIPALMYRDRTYLPVRAVAEISGALVDYDESTEEVILKSENELLNRANLVLHYLKYRDFTQLSSIVHSESGVTFSPYAYIEDSDVRLTAAQIYALKPADAFKWGAYDGSALPITLSVGDYFSKFVFDRDFILAPRIGVDTLIQTGNTISNIDSAYPGASFVEYNVPADNPEYEGIDWASLRLVFKMADGQWMLIGIVHDNWTV